MRALGNFVGRFTVGSGINDKGDVTGSATGTYENPGVAFIWSAQRGFRRLDPPPGYYGSAGASVNNARQVVGTVVLGTLPVRWEATREVRQLGSLGGTTGVANGINEIGQVVGWSRNSGGYPRPFLWNSQSGMRDLGTFLRTEASSGVAWAVNDAGHVVGDADTRDIGRAFLWRDGRLIGIGPELSYAHAVNNLDHVVGQFYVDHVYRAFRYRNGTFRDLNGLIPAGSGVVLGDAQGINDSGWIVANGTNAQGQQLGFLLIPR